MNADPRVMEFMPALLDRTASEAMVDRLQSAIDNQGFGFWAVEAPGVADFIGFVGLAKPGFSAPFTPCVEIGWQLAHGYWGAGAAPSGAIDRPLSCVASSAPDEIASFTYCL